MPDLLRSLVREVGITTSLNPEVRVEPFGAPGGKAEGGGLGELALRLLRPKITVYTSAGPLPIAPYGEPEPLVGLVLLGLLVYAGWLVVRRA